MAPERTMWKHLPLMDECRFLWRSNIIGLVARNTRVLKYICMSHVRWTHGSLGGCQQGGSPRGTSKQRNKQKRLALQLWPMCMWKVCHSLVKSQYNCQTIPPCPCPCPLSCEKSCDWLVKSQYICLTPWPWPLTSEMSCHGVVKSQCIWPNNTWPFSSKKEKRKSGFAGWRLNWSRGTYFWTSGPIL